MRIIDILGPALAATLLVSGCSYFGLRDETGHVVEASLVGVDTVIDPQTGEITTISHWRYDDGVETTTVDRFKKDTPVTDRRATSRAPLRIVD
jgi:hypothetical protein